jgi:hypothetical protein
VEPSDVARCELSNVWVGYLVSDSEQGESTLPRTVTGVSNGFVSRSEPQRVSEGHRGPKGIAEGREGSRGTVLGPRGVAGGREGSRRGRRGSRGVAEGL